MPPSLASHCDLLIDVIILDYGLITDNTFDTLLCFFLLKLPGTHGFFFLWHVAKVRRFDRWGMNQDKYVARPINLCTAFTFSCLLIAATLSGSGWMPSTVNMLTMYFTLVCRSLNFIVIVKHKFHELFVELPSSCSREPELPIAWSVHKCRQWCHPW